MKRLLVLTQVVAALAILVLMLASMSAHAQQVNIAGPGYTQGSWTPHLTGTTSGEATYNANGQIGTYEVIGRQWTARFDLEIATAGTISGIVQISGLPWTQANAANDYGSCIFSNLAAITFPTSTTAILGGFVSPNASVARITASGSNLNSTLTSTNIGNNAELIGVCFGHV